MIFVNTPGIECDTQLEQTFKQNDYEPVLIQLRMMN